MAIAIWFLDIVAYMGYMIYMFGRPSDLYLGLGILALVVGFIGLAASKKFLLLASCFVLFLGVGLTYLNALNTGRIYIWVAALAAMLFFGSMTLRED